MQNRIIVFQDKKIRRVWHNDEWHYSIIDIISILTEQPDHQKARKYWNKLSQRLREEGFETVTICHRLKLPSSDGKSYLTDCANTRSLFRLIQSIPSRKAEPFKRWLAQVGHERIQEIEDPEIGQNRIKEYYELKGYPKEWIDKRLRGIAIRQELTDEWKDRDIITQREFAILTDEISKASFDKTTEEYKKLKKLNRKSQNLRDHMTDWELILTMFGEKATTDITREKDSQGFEECKDSANKGGSITKRAREDLENNLGRSVISEENFLPKNKKRTSKRLR